MRTYVLLFFLSCFFIADSYAQARTRSVVLRRAEARRFNAPAVAINGEVGTISAANSSLRRSRDALRNSYFIRRERTKLRNNLCQKKYNAFVQKVCYAYDALEVPQDSVLLQKDELVVLRKSKKDYYKICLAGEEYYVRRPRG